MAVTVSSGLINVTRGTETLATVYTAVQASAYTSYMVNTSSTYTVANGVVLEISRSATLNMSSGDTLEWDLSASLAPALRIHGTFSATTNCTIIMDKNDTYESDIGVYGSFNAIGTSGNEVVIENVDDIYWYNYIGYGGDDSTWDYVICRNPVPSDTGGSLLYSNYNANRGPKPVYMSNITFSSDDDRGRLYLEGDCSNFVFDNITIDNLYNGTYGGGIYKFANSTFQNMYDYCHYCIALQANPPYFTDQTNKYDSRDFLQQPKITFDNCTFTDNYNRGTTSSSRFFYRTTVKYKDCTLDAYYGLTMFYGSNILVQGTTVNNLTATDDYYWNGGRLFHVRDLNLTVVDSNDNGVAGVKVIVEQAEGKEAHAFITNSEGEIKDLYGDPPVFVEKEQTDDTSFTQWSDSVSSGRYHRILIAKEGYLPVERSVEFTADITLSIQLQNAAGARMISQS